MSNLKALETAVLDLLDVAAGIKAHLSPADHSGHVAAIHAPADDVTDEAPPAAPGSPEPGPDEAPPAAPGSPEPGPDEAPAAAPVDGA